MGPAGPARLSRREKEVMEALLENLSNKEIASKLNMSERTAKFHVSNLLAKYGVRRRADLILLTFMQLERAANARPRRADPRGLAGVGSRVPETAPGPGPVDRPAPLAYSYAPSDEGSVPARAVAGHLESPFLGV